MSTCRHREGRNDTFKANYRTPIQGEFSAKKKRFCENNKTIRLISYRGRLESYGVSKPSLHGADWGNDQCVAWHGQRGNLLRVKCSGLRWRDVYVDYCSRVRLFSFFDDAGHLGIWFTKPP